MIPLLLAAAAFQAVAGAQQAESTRGAGMLGREIADMNAKYADIDAYETEKFGYTQMGRYKSVIDKTVGEQRAAYASQGVDVSFGTAATVQDQTQLRGTLNILDLQSQARMRAAGIRTQASNFRLNGAMSSIQSGITASAQQGQANVGAVTGFASGYATEMRERAKAGQSAPTVGGLESGGSDFEN